jgi:DNA-binding beta-propeller fold protein YncE
MKMKCKSNLLLVGGICLLGALLSGCTTPEPTSTKPFTFFPPAPDVPRIQYLTAFGADTDLGKTGSFADFITGEQKTADPLIKPYGLAVHGGNIFVCDTVAGKIEVFDLQTRRASYFAPVGEGKIRLPINITIDADGTRYVADTGRQQVLIYDANGNFTEALGMKDEMKPTDVGLTTDRIYITDLKNHCVKVFNKADRKFLFSVPVDAKPGEARLLSPTNLAIDREGKRLLVSDTGGNVVQIYDLDGKYIRTIGRAGVAPGAFARPKGVAVDKQGLTYVVDAATQVVQIFDTEGRLLLFFGQAGASTQGETLLPAAVKVDYDHVANFKKYVAPGRECEYLILVTSQFGGQKVSVYGFLKQK